jgi:hypothetical protein
MKNSFWEEQLMSDDIKKFHNEVNSEIGIPDWAQIDCPFCKEKIKYSGIRNIGLCLNARNVGDISVEFHCDDCMIMDTVYFRRVAEGVREFALMMDGGFEPEVEPVVEEEMYQLKYHNLIEKMIGESHHGDD